MPIKHECKSYIASSLFLLIYVYSIILLHTKVNILIQWINRSILDGWNRWSYTIGHFLFISCPSMTFSCCFSQTKKNYSRLQLVTWTSLIIVWILNNILTFDLISVIDYQEIKYVPFLINFPLCHVLWLIGPIISHLFRILKYIVYSWIITYLLIFILDFRCTNKKYLHQKNFLYSVIYLHNLFLLH